MNGHGVDLEFDGAVSSGAKIRGFADIPDIIGMKVAPVEYIVPALGIARNTITLWTGPDGDGKTYLAQAMAIAVARGDVFLGMDCLQSPVLYLDLDSFKAFNDNYGFVHGDEAIQLVAGIAVDVVRRRGTSGDFVGHIGGDDFILVTVPERGEEMAREIVASFDTDIRTLYNAQDLRQGYIETRDRRGTLNRFPIMTISIALISNEAREFESYAQIGEAAAELKRYAKSIGGSVFVKEKRRS